MFNITDTVQLLLAAEKVKASKHLTDAERLDLLIALRDTVPEMVGIPAAASLVRNSLCRMIEDERPNTYASNKAKGRKAQGGEKPTSVATGRTEEETEATEGETSGSEEPAQDAGSVSSSGG